MAAGAAGEAKAAEGVAGESSMLPWDDAGLSHIFSEGRYCTHCFLLLIEKSGEGRGKKEKLNYGSAAGFKSGSCPPMLPATGSERAGMAAAVSAVKSDMLKSTWKQATTETGCKTYADGKKRT